MINGLSAAKHAGFLLFTTLLISVYGSKAQNNKLESILDQLRIELVQPGTVSTRHFEFGTSISPDETELFFVKGISGFRRTVLVFSIWKNGRWTEPKIAPFSGKYQDLNPYHSKDGKKLYFTSDRPTEDSLSKSNLWYVERVQDSWSHPKLVEGKINDQYDIIYPTIQRDGTIHFVSWSRPGSKGGDIFISKLKNGTYDQPAPVDELNTEASDADPEVSLDGKMMFLTSNRPGGLGHYDLYVFKKQQDGKWGEGINLGPKINSINMDSDPILASDGKTLYFSSDRLNSSSFNSEKLTDYKALVNSYDDIHNGLMNIYKVDISELITYLNKDET